MLRELLVAFALFSACSTVVAPAPLIPPIRQPETEALPPKPKDEPIPDTVPSERWVAPLRAGSCLDKDGNPLPTAPKPCPPKSGVLSSEARAIEDGRYRLRYDELRTITEQDRKIWEIQRQYYELDLAKKDREIHSLIPSWLDRNSLPIGVVGGFTIGITISSLLLFLRR